MRPIQRWFMSVGAGASMPLLLSLAAPAGAQDSVRLVPGMRVRVGVEHYAMPRFTGQLLAAGDTIVVRLDGNRETMPVPVRVPRRDVRSMEVSRGLARNNTMMGAAIGAIAGAVILGLSAPDEEEAGWGAPSLQGMFVVGGAGLGGIVGALVGYASSPERWVPARGWR